MITETLLILSFPALCFFAAYLKIDNHEKSIVCLGFCIFTVICMVAIALVGYLNSHFKND